MEIDKKEPEQDERLSKMAATIGRMQIEALAQSAGAIDAGAVAAIVNQNTKAEIDALGVVKIQMIDAATGDRLRNVNGTEMTVGQFIGQMKADPDHGYLFTDGAAGKPKAKVGGGIATETNPWMPATWNLTEQGRLLKSEPVFAARLQAAAKGLRPENPFSPEGFNLTKQSNMLRDDPALAARMQAEVAPKERNPWLKGQENLTAQVIMIRSNPDKARRLQAEAATSNGSAPKKSYIFTPPPGAFKRLGTGR